MPVEKVNSRRRMAVHINDDNVNSGRKRRALTRMFIDVRFVFRTRFSLRHPVRGQWKVLIACGTHRPPERVRYYEVVVVVGLRR